MNIGIIQQIAHQIDLTDMMGQSLERKISTSWAESPACCLGALTDLSAGPILCVWGKTLTWQWLQLRDFFLHAQVRSPTVNCIAWSKFWCFPLQTVSRAAHFCYRDRPATDPQLYLLLWYKLYVLEVQGALGVQASQEGPGERKWKTEDIRQIFSYAIQLSLPKEGQGAQRAPFNQEVLC